MNGTGWMRGALAAAALTCAAAARAGEGITAAEHEAMAARLEQAWQRLMTVYYSPKTHLFYERPVERVAPARAFEGGFLDPDKAGGYGAGMEDCAIHGGVALSMLVDRYEVTGEEALRGLARDVCKGLRLCATAHGVEGFVARGVCAEDGRGVCLTSSRDQYTHFVHGLWRYSRSGLCDEETRGEIRELMRAVAERMIRNVTPANDYDFLRADGSRDPRGICRMWNVRPHEAARLPMIYAAAWDLCREEKYRALYREYVGPAAEQSLALATLPQAEVNRWMPTYTLLQMQTSLEVLAELETEEALRRKLVAAMQPVARMAAERAVRVNGGEERWLCACGEAALAQLMARGFGFSAEQERLVHKSVMDSDPERVGTSRTVHLHAVYWRARRLGLFAKQ